MNAKNSMKALLDGQTVEDCYGRKYKLNNNGMLISDGHDDNHKLFINLIKKVEDEYPLTFEQALIFMLNGKVCECKEILGEIRFDSVKGNFVCIQGGDMPDLPVAIEVFMQSAKWRMVV